MCPTGWKYFRRLVDAVINGCSDKGGNPQEGLINVARAFEPFWEDAEAIRK